MASILKVSQLQKPDGSTPTAADLGIIKGVGEVVKVVTNRDSTDYIYNTTSRLYPIDITVTTQETSKFVINVTCPVYADGGTGAWPNMAFQGIEWTALGDGTTWYPLLDFEHDAVNVTAAYARTMGGTATTGSTPAGTYKFRYWVQPYGSVSTIYFNRDIRYTEIAVTQVKA